MASDGIGALSMRVLEPPWHDRGQSLLFPNKQALFAATASRNSLDQYTEAGVTGIENPRELAAPEIRRPFRKRWSIAGVLLHPPRPCANSWKRRTARWS